MLILLPPSEGKSAPDSLSPFNFEALQYSTELTPTRKVAIAEAGIDAKKQMAAEAISVYTGVLYKALDWNSLPAKAKKRGERSLRIISALFGVVTPTNEIFPYKSKIKTSQWKDVLTKIFESHSDELVIDCRSSTYRGVWTPPHDRTIEVRVFQEKVGVRSVITHMSKKYRGEVARELLMAEKTPDTVEEVIALLSAKFRLEHTRAARQDPHFLDVIVEI